MEPSRTSLASRTHFEVLGFGLKGQVPGLETSSSRKLPCPWPRTALCSLKDQNLAGKCQKPCGKFARTFFCFFGDRLKKNFEELFVLFCFWSTLAPVFLILGLSRGSETWGGGGEIQYIPLNILTVSLPIFEYGLHLLLPQ